MTNESISCPYCEKSIPLSKAISHEVDLRLQTELSLREDALKKEFQADKSAAIEKAIREAKAVATTEVSEELASLKDQLSEQDVKLRQTQQLELRLRQEHQRLEAEKAEIELRVAREIDEQRKQIEEAAVKRAAGEQDLIVREKDQVLEEMKKQIEDLKTKAEQGSQQLQGEVLELKGQLSEQELKLRETQQLEIKLRREQQKLETEKAETELRVAREIDEQRKEIEESAFRRAADQQSLIDREKDQRLEQMKRQIEDLKRKAEQGSQQLQGEVLELDLEERLSAMFPLDNFKAVAKGVNGADLIQEVCDRSGEVCGLILWEAKRTKNWSDGWLTKLRADQLASKADVAILLSQALPKDCETFQQMAGLWVTSQACAFDLVMVLRLSLVELAKARRAAQGKSEKMEILYDYLSSPQFGTRVESVLNTLASMKGDLDTEKRAFSRIWAKRQSQLEGVIGGVSHMVGDLQAIGDLTLYEVKSLQLQAVAEPGDSLALKEMAVT